MSKFQWWSDSLKYCMKHYYTLYRFPCQSGLNSGWLRMQATVCLLSTPTLYQNANAPTVLLFVVLFLTYTIHNEIPNKSILLHFSVI